MKNWVCRVLVITAVVSCCAVFEQVRRKSELISEFQEAVSAKNYGAARSCLHFLSYRDIRKIASANSSGPLQRAFDTIQKVQDLDESERTHALQAAFFIETVGFERRHFVPKSESGLAFDVEYDPVSKCRFIYLNKVVGKEQKHILYDYIAPHLEATPI